MFRYLILISLFLSLPQFAAAVPSSWATYTVTFDATWSGETHPETFPPNPHFSGLIGGTHDANISFWAAGALATTGIKQMAEWGSQTTLAAEVDMAIAAGNAGEVISSDVLWNSPGQIATSFTIHPEHSLVTLTTMIAPSPDWFAGVNGLDLLAGDQWVTELVVPLYPYDAGTDSGVNYTSGDLPSNPAVAIAAIAGSPFTPGVPVGTLTFRLDAAAAVALPKAALSIQAYPNPFNPSTTLRYDVPAGAGEVGLAIYDVRGKLVRRLAVDRSPGAKAIGWDGRSGRGIAVPSGVYFARLNIDGFAVVQKMALVQ